MSDETNTDYTKMFGNSDEVAVEPETIEDLVDLEVVAEEAPVEPVVVEEAFVPPPAAFIPEPVLDTDPLIFVPLVDDGLRLNIRESPDGPIKAKVASDTLLTCVEDGQVWAWVEFEVDGELVRGYAKKEFLVTANG